MRLLQLLKAYVPISVTELGMSIETRSLHPINDSAPIDVTVLGIIVFLHPLINLFVAVSIIALQLLRES